MLKDSEIKEIRQLLKKSERPLFLYDDDPDGLCSYLLLRRYIDRGTGVAAKASPIIDESYLRKVEELRPDRIFILDKPLVTQEFVDESKVPIVWIDHHDPVELEHVKYYNSKKNNKNLYIPVSYMCYQITKQDQWIAMIGTISDGLLPDFTEDFIKNYPGLLGHVKNVGEAVYTSEIGRLTKLYHSLLKGTTSDVKKTYQYS